MSSIIPSLLPPSLPSMTLPPASLITTPPTLHLPRAPQAPTPDELCSSSASQSASIAIQQATQSASQAASAASRDASQSIAQFSNTMSQSLAAASRSVSSALSALSSVQASASAAVSKANASVGSAQAQASSAAVQAGAAVAAATGAAQSQVASQINLANQRVAASQNAAVTATQAALAIVGSVIASTLITILVYFLITRHRNRAASRSRNVLRKDRRDDGLESPSSGAEKYFGTGKWPHQGKGSVSTITTINSVDEEKKRNEAAYQASSTIEKQPLALGGGGKSKVKTTTVKWNPSKPPQVPTLGGWLKSQDKVSPFGPIKLPGEKTPSPLSQNPQIQQTNNTIEPPMSIAKPAPAMLNSNRAPRDSLEGNKKTVVSNMRSSPAPVFPGPKSPATPIISPSSSVPSLPRRTSHPQKDKQAKDMRKSNSSSIWSNNVPSTPGMTPPLSPSMLPKSEALGSKPLGLFPSSVKLPLQQPMKAARNTAEWVAARRLARESIGPSYSNQIMPGTGYNGPWRPSIAGGLPGNPRLAMSGRLQARSPEIEVNHPSDESRPNTAYSTAGRDALQNRMGGYRSGLSVGKAL